jgi:DNA topoisomerase-1
MMRRRNLQGSDRLGNHMVRGLVYVSDKDPGIARRRHGRNFRYIGSDGRAIRDEGELSRIKGLGVPPAYENVWICALANGHIQATGFDAARRKQYRYHPDWTLNQDKAKFDKLAEFGLRLPRLRRRVEATLKEGANGGQFGKELACGALVRLIDQTAIRIGGRSKASQGATTLTARNVQLDRNRMHFRFTAKGGKRVQATLDDRRLQRILGKIHDLPGKRLFQYIGQDGLVHPLDSGDVNDWLKEVAAMPEVSAKMFRTWHGSVVALEALRTAKKPTVKLACEAAAEVLCNTPAIARKSYVHPAILELAGDPAALAKFRGLSSRRRAGLSAAESRLLQLIGG